MGGRALHPSIDAGGRRLEDGTDPHRWSIQNQATGRRGRGLCGLIADKIWDEGFKKCSSEGGGDIKAASVKEPLW